MCGFGGKDGRKKKGHYPYFQKAQSLVPKAKHKMLCFFFFFFKSASYVLNYENTKCQILLQSKQ